MGYSKLCLRYVLLTKTRNRSIRFSINWEFRNLSTTVYAEIISFQSINVQFQSSKQCDDHTPFLWSHFVLSSVYVLCVIPVENPPHLIQKSSTNSLLELLYLTVLSRFFFKLLRCFQRGQNLLPFFRFYFTGQRNGLRWKARVTPLNVLTRIEILPRM